MPTIMPIYGTRPEAIKMAPIIEELRSNSDLDCFVTVTGQHRAMLDQVNDLFGIHPDHDLDILQHGQSLNNIFSRVIAGLDVLFDKNQPDAVLVQGDTSTSTAAALAAFYRGIPVVHAEAGLRSGDIAAPFPEEGNRRLTSQIASLHLAPTATSRRNLIAEGIESDDIAVTGNTVIDALLSTVSKQIGFSDQALESLAESGRKILLVTTHRRENQGNAMEGMGRAIAKIANEEPDVTVVLPVHKNPVVRRAVLPPLENLSNVLVVEPLSYGEFTRIMSIANIVLTDSGGVQEEAPSLGIPVLVMRENTERPEAVDSGTVRLIGTDEDRIVREVSSLLNDAERHTTMANAVNPYGDGRAAQRSVAAIESMFKLGARMEDFV